MNKKIIYIALLLLSAIGFQSCSDDMAKPPIQMPEQSGNGSAFSPYNVGAALVKVYSGEYDSRNVFVEGIVSKIDGFEAAYGNMTYYISDDGAETNQLEVYRGLGLNGQRFTAADELKVGDKVIICCQLTYYNNSVAETNQGAFIISLNGSPYEAVEPLDPAGTGVKEDPYNVIAALNAIYAGAPEQKVYVKGIVSQVGDISTSYGNGTYYISDTGTAMDQLEIYRGYSLGGKKFSSETEIKVGDEVVVYGQVVLFNSTPEFTTGSIIVVLNGVEDYGSNSGNGDNGGSTGQSPADPTGEGTQASPYNVAKAQSIIAAGTYTDDAVYIEGTISSIKEIDTSSFGNATYYISDDGTSAGALMIYRGYYLNGDKFTSADQIKVGDKVVVNGKLINYQGNTPEVTQGSKITSLNGQTSGGNDTPDTPDTPADAIYSGLSANMDGWTIDNGTLPEGLTYVWKWDEQNKYLKASAYVNPTYYATDAVATMALDLTGKTSASAAFDHTYKFGADIPTSLTFVAREQGSTEWTALTIPTWPTGKDWTFVNSGAIDLSVFAGKKIEIGFRYKSTTSAAATWEVKNLVISAK